MTSTKILAYPSLHRFLSAHPLLGCLMLSGHLWPLERVVIAIDCFIYFVLSYSLLGHSFSWAIVSFFPCYLGGASSPPLCCDSHVTKQDQSEVYLKFIKEAWKGSSLSVWA